MIRRVQVVISVTGGPPKLRGALWSHCGLHAIRNHEQYAPFCHRSVYMDATLENTALLRYLQSDNDNSFPSGRISHEYGGVSWLFARHIQGAARRGATFPCLWNRGIAAKGPLLPTSIWRRRGWRRKCSASTDMLHCIV